MTAYIHGMETDPTQLGIDGVKHPSIAELRDPSHPEISAHLASCTMCQAVANHDGDDVPIALDLPKGLVSENAFRWPADPIAKGGMAQIFAGEDRRLARTVILKAPRDGDELPVGMAEMFAHRVTAEARILAKLQHPAIVTIYELGKSTVGWPFCVLQRVEGISLRDRLDELAEAEADGRPRTRERLELLSNLVAIAEAMAYAHERRVVHRDITPNNVLLGKRGEATLIDWGIARDLEAPGLGDLTPLDGNSPSMSGRMVTISAGTPPYLPLEQSQGRAAEPSFDVYSFGILLYEVVAGRTPFEWRNLTDARGRAAQLEAFLRWLKADDDAPPAMARDPELSGIIARAISKRSANRFTADELVRALKQYLTGDLVFSHRYSMTGRLSRWVRQHRAVSVTFAFVAASAVAGALVWAQLSRQAREEAELRAVASGARADASERGRAADIATQEAEQARLRADQAEREGKDAQQLRELADKKRKAAEAMRGEAEVAATRAKGAADDAVKESKEAQKERDDAESARDLAVRARADAEAARDAARLAQAVAEKERDAARQARSAAEAERDSAKQTAAAAEGERDAARAGQTRAESERDAARTAGAAAEKERDAAVASRSSAEVERDDARKKVNELEAKLRARKGAGASSGNTDGAAAPAPGPTTTPSE